MIYETKIITALKIIAPNIQFIFAYRNGVEPKAPYCLVTMMNTTNIGKPHLTSTVQDGREVEAVTQTKELEVSFTFHLSATDTLQDWVDIFHIGLGSSFYTNAFGQNGLGIIDYTDIKYLENPVDSTVMYKDAVIDIIFRFDRIEEFYAPHILEVETRGNLGESYEDFKSDVIFT